MANSKSSIMNPQARDAMDKFKMEAAQDFDVHTHIKRNFTQPVITKISQKSEIQISSNELG